MKEHRPLRRDLRIWEAIGISLALMAPSMAANINPQGMVASVGRAIPLAFILATVGVLLVAYTFVRLTARFHHAGSVYGFVGATLGPRSGVVAGWGLVGTYALYGVVTTMAFGRFTAGLAASLTHTQPSDALAYGLGLASLAPVLVLALWPARLGTRVLLVVEGLTVGLILIVCVVVLAKLARHSGVAAPGVDMAVFRLAPGTSTSNLFFGAVFGFLSFAGFEAASTLGEETRNPRRNIPRAILGVAIFGGVYFVFVTAVTVMGFGTGKTGLKAFAGSSALVGDLGTRYVASWIGDLISAGAAISALGCVLACCVGASRLTYALGRDGVSLRQFDTVHARRGTPTNATLAVIGAVLAMLLVAGLICRGSILAAWQEATGSAGAPTTLAIFSIAGTAGTLILLVVYGLATVGVIALARAGSSLKVHQLALPILGLAVLAYTVFRNLYPFPTGAGWWAPALAMAWLMAGLVWVVARRKATGQAGLALLSDEGLGRPQTHPDTPPSRVERGVR